MKYAIIFITYTFFFLPLFSARAVGGNGRNFKPVISWNESYSLLTYLPCPWLSSAKPASCNTLSPASAKSSAVRGRNPRSRSDKTSAQCSSRECGKYSAADLLPTCLVLVGFRKRRHDNYGDCFCIQFSHIDRY